MRVLLHAKDKGAVGARNAIGHPLGYNGQLSVTQQQVIVLALERDLALVAENETTLPIRLPPGSGWSWMRYPWS